LPDIIGEQQSAFVSACLKTDKIFLAYERVHKTKKKQGKKGLCAVKLDMHKAHDRVEWCFLEKIMLKLGFGPRYCIQFNEMCFLKAVSQEIPVFPMIVFRKTYVKELLMLFRSYGGVMMMTTKVCTG
jgi:hypothetical protein